MRQLREVTGTDTPVTPAPVGPVTEDALAGCTDTGVEWVVLEPPTLDEAATAAKLDEFMPMAEPLGW
jgi:hypothetical protein